MRFGITFGLALFFISAGVAAEAQSAPPLQSQIANKIWRLGVLSPIDFEQIRGNVLAGLARHNLVEGQNLILDVQIGTVERLPDLARSLVAAKPDAIIAVSDWAVRSAREATSTIPIIMSPVGQDPVSAGIVSSWGRPGGNITGIVLLVPELDEKRVALLHETVPAAGRLAVLTTHDTPNTEIRSAATRVGLELIERSASGPNEYRTIFESMHTAGAQALIIAGTPELNRDAEALASIALRAGLPTICTSRAAAERGCLIGYGPNLPKLYQRVGNYADFPWGKPWRATDRGANKYRTCIEYENREGTWHHDPKTLVALADDLIE
jgi:putative ABC transport system substrate-binding protein